jgi:multiple sugar transport system substrate-binding protein
LAVIVLFASLAPAGFAGGSAEGSSAATGPAKVTLWHMPWSPNFEPYMAGVAEKFEAENPNIEVETIMLPWSGREAKFMAAIAADDTPDVTLVGADVAAKLEDGGGLVPLDDFDIDLKGFQKRLIKDTSFKGHMWGLPLAIETTALTYNADFLEKAGLGTEFNKLPSTWKNYTEAMIKLTVDENGDGTPERYGTNWRPMGSAWAGFVPYLQAAGGEMFDPEGKTVTFNGKEGVETLTWFTDMHNKYKVIPPGVPSSHDDMYEIFLAGKTATLIHSDGDFIAQLAREYPDKNVVVGPALKNKNRVTQGWIGIAVLFKASKSKEAAVKWIEFLGRDDINQGILEECGYVSVKDTVTNERTAALSESMARAMEQTRLYGRPPAAHWVARDVNGPLRPELEAAFLGQKSPQEALDTAAKAVQKWLDER